RFLHLRRRSRIWNGAANSTKSNVVSVMESRGAEWPHLPSLCLPAHRNSYLSRRNGLHGWMPMSFSMEFDGLGCPHFAAYLKQTPGELVFTWKGGPSRRRGS